jgi:hypothetical protein
MVRFVGAVPLAGTTSIAWLPGASSRRALPHRERHLLVAVDDDLAVHVRGALHDDDADRLTTETLEDARRDLAERVVVLVLQVVGVVLLENGVGLAALIEMDLGGDLTGLRALRDVTPDIPLGLDLLADALLAVGRRTRRALERGGQHAERLRGLDERPTLRRADARTKRARERIGLILGIFGVEGEDRDRHGVAAALIRVRETRDEQRHQRDAKRDRAQQDTHGDPHRERA